MGNTTCSAINSADIDEAAMRKRHCLMQRKILGAELALLMGEARGEHKDVTRSRRMLLARIKQVKGQMDQLERVELSFERIANIKQTATMVQQVKSLLDENGDLPSADSVLDLEDAISDSQDTLQSIEEAFARPWQEEAGEITEGQLQRELDNLFGGGAAPPPAGPSVEHPLKDLNQAPNVPSGMLLTSNPREKTSQSSHQKILEPEA